MTAQLGVYCCCRGNMCYRAIPCLLLSPVTVHCMFTVVVMVNCVIAQLFVYCCYHGNMCD